jgi:hypothetical protein
LWLFSRPNSFAFETEFGLQPGQEILQKWNQRAARVSPRMEITGDGLMLGAGMILAKKARDKRGKPRQRAQGERRCRKLIGPGAATYGG